MLSSSFFSGVVIVRLKLSVGRASRASSSDNPNCVPTLSLVNIYYLYDLVLRICNYKSKKFRENQGRMAVLLSGLGSKTVGPNQPPLALYMNVRGKNSGIHEDADD
jgi:hypothetical protein